MKYNGMNWNNVEHSICWYKNPQRIHIKATEFFIDEILKSLWDLIGNTNTLKSNGTTSWNEDWEKSGTDEFPYTSFFFSLF